MIAAAFIIFGSLVGCSRPDDSEGASGATDEAATYKWKMVTSWPKNFPGLGTGANLFAEQIDLMSNGRITVEVYGGGELVGALEVFDAVSRGTAEVGHSASYYWVGKDEVAQFFTAIPFGFTAQEMNGWLFHGGGMELWEKLYAKHNLVPLAAGNSGVQMGGWFNKEINSIADVRGLKMRIPGFSGKVLSEAGGAAITLPGGEIFSSLQSGAIDAAEFVGPYNDLALGFYKAARYYYYPGWHEPGTTLEAMVNKDAFDALPEDLQAIVRAAARVTNDDMLAEFTAQNNRALETLVNEHDVQLRRFPQPVLNEFARISTRLLDETAANNPEFKEVYDSVKKFRADVMKWHDISELPYLEARKAALRGN